MFPRNGDEEIKREIFDFVGCVCVRGKMDKCKRKPKILTPMDTPAERTNQPGRANQREGEKWRQRDPGSALGPVSKRRL